MDLGLSSDLNRIGEGFETGDFEPIRSRTGDLLSWFLGLLYVERDAFIAGRIESDSFGLKWFSRHLFASLNKIAFLNDTNMMI